MSSGSSGTAAGPGGTGTAFETPWICSALPPPPDGGLALGTMIWVRAGAVLPAYDLRVDVGAGDRPQRADHLELFIAHDLRIERSRRLGCDERQELEDVVLHHIAERAGLLVVPRARSDALFLGHRDLHVIDVSLIEERLENAVCEPQDEDVLDRFLAEIVIDAEDLPFVEHFGDRIVDRERARQVASDRFLDDQPRERCFVDRGDEPGAREILHRRHERRRWDGQIIDAIAGQPAFVLDRIEPGAERGKRALVFERDVREEQRFGEGLPQRLLRRPPRELNDAVLRELAISLVG